MSTDSDNSATYISLGGDCAVGYQIRKHLLDAPSYPFDWIKCDSIDALCKIFTDDFSIFFDETHFIIKPNTPNSHQNESHQNLSSNYKILNKFYNIILPHEYISDVFDMNEFREKYTRRIERFKKDLRNKFKKKIFIRGGNSKYLSKLDQDRLITQVESYGGVNFEIRFIDYDKFSPSLPTDYTWKRDYIDWKQFLT